MITLQACMNESTLLHMIIVTLWECSPRASWNSSICPLLKFGSISLSVDLSATASNHATISVFWWVVLRGLWAINFTSSRIQPCRPSDHSYYFRIANQYRLPSFWRARSRSGSWRGDYWLKDRDGQLQICLAWDLSS